MTKKVAQRVLDELNRTGISQAELARKLGFNEALLSTWLHPRKGEKQLERAFKILRGLPDEVRL